jgi:hypothetical protein
VKKIKKEIRSSHGKNFEPLQKMVEGIKKEIRSSHGKNFEPLKNGGIPSWFIRWK